MRDCFGDGSQGDGATGQTAISKNKVSHPLFPPEEEKPKTNHQRGTHCHIKHLRNPKAEFRSFCAFDFSTPSPSATSFLTRSRSPSLAKRRSIASGARETSRRGQVQSPVSVKLTNREHCIGCHFSAFSNRWLRCLATLCAFSWWKGLRWKGVGGSWSRASQTCGFAF